MQGQMGYHLPNKNYAGTGSCIVSNRSAGPICAACSSAAATREYIGTCDTANFEALRQKSTHKQSTVNLASSCTLHTRRLASSNEWVLAPATTADMHSITDANHIQAVLQQHCDYDKEERS